jgi:D-xylose transport system substrate-binding protein
MNVSLRRARRLAVAVGAAVTMAACSSSSSTKTTATTAGGSTATTAAANITATSFTSDFSAMAQLKSIAAKGKGLIGVLLPDTTTSARYESFDRPYQMRAFQAAGLSASDFKIDNAQGSASTMQTQAEADITQGASVLLVDALDSGSGAAIEANATSKGVKVIDYDRLIKGGTAGRTYVSFDNVGVGKLIGQGEVDCITAWNVTKPNILVMDGDPTDNNATLFAQGYNGVLKTTAPTSRSASRPAPGRPRWRPRPSTSSSPPTRTSTR